MKMVMIKIVPAALLVCGVAAAGPLDPPSGPPSSTMKTISEVEPRRAVQSLPGSASAMFVISEPGSYYLTGNILAAGAKHGILITASNVTLDLSGFSVIGAGGSGSISGIIATGTPASVRVMNGTVENWPTFGVGLSETANAEVSNVIVRNCSGGIWVGQDSSIRNCKATGSSQIGIFAKAGSTISDCIARSCASNGFHLTSTATLTNCTASQCGLGFAANGAVSMRGCIAESSTGHGFHVASGSLRDCISRKNGQNGFVAGDDSTLEGCTAKENTGLGFHGGSGVRMQGCTAAWNNAGGALLNESVVVTGSTFMSNHNYGLFIEGPNSVVNKCTASRNHGDGIRAHEFATITENTCFANAGATPTFAGIRVTAGGNRIEGNSLNQNGTGIIASSAGNMIVRNGFTHNPTRVSAVAGNNVAEMIIVPGDNFVATNPLANLAY